MQDYLRVRYVELLLFDFKQRHIRWYRITGMQGPLNITERVLEVMPLAFKIIWKSLEIVTIKPV